MSPIYVNGKFTAQPTTGVQRVASRLVRALDVQGAGWVLLCPRGSNGSFLAPVTRGIERREVGWPGLPLHLWEQVVLPFASRDGTLVNLAGTAPLGRRGQVSLLHDAAVFDRPEGLTATFAAWYRLQYHWLARTGARLLTVSRFSQGRLAARLRTSREIEVISAGADHFDDIEPDTSLLVRHGLVDSPFLLAVASHNPNKNLPRLLRAFSQLSDRHAALRLVIVGDGNRRVFAEGGDAADPPGVVRLGAPSDAALKALYRHALALVFPSLYEGFGLPPLEAMACGCPVAVSTAASIPEVCGDAALYFDPMSVDAIAAVLGRLVNEPALRDGLRLAGLRRAALFRWTDSARALQAFVHRSDPVAARRDAGADA